MATEKEVFRDLEASAEEAHFAVLRQGGATGPGSGARYLDLLRDLKRINTHLVAAAAYPVLAAEGTLLPNRLRQEPEAI